MSGSPDLREAAPVEPLPDEVRLQRMLDKSRSRVWRDDEDGKLYVGLNDFFAPAADAEEIPADQLAIVLDAWEAHGWWGILNWVIQRRYVLPERVAVQDARERVPPSSEAIQQFADWLKATFPRGVLWAEQGPISAAQMILARVDGVGAPLVPAAPLSSDFLDAFRGKIARGESVTLRETAELLGAHDSLLAAYHETEFLRGGSAHAAAPAPSEKAKLAGIEAAEKAADTPGWGLDGYPEGDDRRHVRCCDSRRVCDGSPAVGRTSGGIWGA